MILSKEVGENKVIKKACGKREKRENEKRGKEVEKEEKAEACFLSFQWCTLTY